MRFDEAYVIRLEQEAEAAEIQARRLRRKLVVALSVLDRCSAVLWRHRHDVPWIDEPLSGLDEARAYLHDSLDATDED